MFPVEVRVSSGLMPLRGSGCSRLGCGLSPLGGGPCNPTTEPQNLLGLRNRLLAGTNRTLCTRTQEKGAVTPQETDPDLPINVQESLVEAWVGGGCYRAGGTEYSSACMGPFEGGHYLHTSAIVWPQVNNREETKPHPSTENWIKDL